MEDKPSGRKPFEIFEDFMKKLVKVPYEPIAKKPPKKALKVKRS